MSQLWRQQCRSIHSGSGTLEIPPSFSLCHLPHLSPTGCLVCSYAHYRRAKPEKRGTLVSMMRKMAPDVTWLAGIEGGSHVYLVTSFISCHVYLVTSFISGYATSFCFHCVPSLICMNFEPDQNLAQCDPSSGKSVEGLFGTRSVFVLGLSPLP